jgi:hypothetical protein
MQSFINTILPKSNVMLMSFPLVTMNKTPEKICLKKEQFILAFGFL